MVNFKFKFKFKFHRFLIYKFKKDDGKLYYLYKRVFLFCYKKIDESTRKDFYQTH